MNHIEHEKLIMTLNDPETLRSYKTPYDNEKTGIIPLILGKLLVVSGTIIYGKEPSYGKFKAIEVIARIPYQSWEMVTYMILTLLYSNEKRAIDLSKMSAFSRLAQDNETMHVVVLSQLLKQNRESNNIIIHTFVPLVFSFFYFVSSYLLYMFSHKKALELNYLFEEHAFEQYDRFLKNRGEELKKKPVKVEFLDFYGRSVASEYDLFLSIRNDEIVHRNISIERVHKKYS